MGKGRGLHTSMDTREKDWQGAILEAGYYMKVASDPFLTSANRQFSVLCSLNLSVAFDTDDYLFYMTLSL